MRKWTPFAVTNVVFVYNYMHYSPNQDTSLIRNPSSVSRVPDHFYTLEEIERETVTKSLF